MLTLVHARTPGAPQDTVRAWNTGRGRQSTTRGQRRCLSQHTTTLSRIPSAPSETTVSEFITTIQAEDEVRAAKDSFIGCKPSLWEFLC